MVAPVALLSTLVAVLPSAPWERWDDLKSLAIVEQPDRVLLRSSYCPDGCGFDRTSDGDPRFLRIEDDEAVIFESRNPGAIVRVWMTMGFGTSEPLNSDVSIRIYLDDYDIPAIDEPLPDFFDGADPRWPSPIAGSRLESSGGNYNLLPLPYAERAKIVLVNAVDQRIWFQIHHHQRPVGETIEPLSAEDVSAWRDFLAEPAPWSGASQSGTVVLDAGERRVLDRPGPGWIMETTLRTAGDLDSLALSWQFDQSAPLPAVPALLYFALGDASAINHSRLVGRSVTGTLYDRFPKPFRQRAQLLLENTGLNPLTIEYTFQVDDQAPPANAATFGVQRSAQCPAEPGLDWPLVELEGRGRWVGQFQLIRAFEGNRRTYLEGDERVYVDGEIDPSWHGTGVEDFYAGGFYYDGGPFTLPLHGNPFYDPSTISDRTAMYRFMLHDYVAFDQSLRVAQEVGRRNNFAACHESLAWYYLAPSPQTAPRDVMTATEPSLVAHDFVASDRQCTALSSAFVDNPQTATTLTVCSLDGEATWGMTWLNPTRPATLLRTFDTADGGGSIDVRINDELVGSFGPAAPNTDRRWAQDRIDLLPRGLLPEPTRIEFIAAAQRANFARFELISRPAETILDDGFEAADGTK